MRQGKCKKCGDTYTYDDYGPGTECSCKLVSSEREERETKEVLKAVAYWFLPSRPGGQAESTLQCGHGGPVGAPCCKRCAQKQLERVLNEF